MAEARFASRGIERAAVACRRLAARRAARAIFAPLVAPQDPLAQDLMFERLPPFWMQGAEPGFWLGTDSLGRDLLSRLIYGGRIAFIVAFAAAIAACLVGSALGLIAGYFGGWADRIVSRIVDVWMAFPPVLVRDPAGRGARHRPRARSSSPSPSSTGRGSAGWCAPRR